MSWLSLLPPLVAILIALWRREVILALLAAILLAELILAGGQPLSAFLHAIERIAAVSTSADNARILLFSLLIGALLALIRFSGGVAAFVRWLLHSGLARSPRAAGLLTCLLGTLIFIESNLSILACGTFGQQLFDRHGLSRARLALMVDATCGPVSVLLLLNGWGAYVLGLLALQPLDAPVAVLLASIPLNFYGLLVLALTFHLAWSGHSFGSLARHEQDQPSLPAPETAAATGKAGYFLLPMVLLVGGIVGFMYYTGEGSLLAGSGASSVLYAMCLALLALWLWLLKDGVATHADLLQLGFRGIGELLPVVSILLLAFALGAALLELQTGAYVASLIPAQLPQWLLAPVVFLTACLISFTTGTSWGTFGILVPVAVPLALATGASPALLLAAVLGGGVFGDHCSPISDSTVLSSLASGCDHLLHVRTQLPYAL
ncbi:MAG: Na+/H+ antiporter NhaC family protein, partial [Pseudohongiellaceae bacterium]